VGWFRTHSRPGLFLDQHDYHLMCDFFGHPAAVALLVRPDDEAGFFVWEQGHMHRVRPARTFPLRPDALGDRATPAPAESPAAYGPATVNRWWSNLKVPTFPGGARLHPLLRWSPVVLGLVAGWFWTPGALRDVIRDPAPMAANRNTVPRGNAEKPVERPVFGREESAQVKPVVDAPAPATAPPPPVQTRARQGAATRQTPPRMLQLPPPRPAERTPVLEVASAPSVTALAKFEPPVKSTVPARQAATVNASWEPVPGSGLRRAVVSIPGLGFLKKKRNSGKEDGNRSWVPPRAVRQYRPPFANGFDEPVRIRVRIGDDGPVRSATLLTRNVSSATAQSAIEAARRWRFEPARQNKAPVESELVITFQSPGVKGG
jgi:TonB family protein